MSTYTTKNPHPCGDHFIKYKSINHYIVHLELTVF